MINIICDLYLFFIVHVFLGVELTFSRVVLFARLVVCPLFGNYEYMVYY